MGQKLNQLPKTSICSISTSSRLFARSFVDIFINDSLLQLKQQLNQQLLLITAVSQIL